MNRKRLVLIVLPVLALGLALILAKPFARPWDRLRRGAPLNVLVLTIDTLRADRLGCYGFAGIETPAIDRLAEAGVRFGRCIAPTPLTLPSHTSIMTGTLPLFHGVRDNGGFVVPPALTTLAESFREGGYRTGAFVAAYVLDSKWGLNQGFETYFDDFDLSRYEKISLASVQRRAGEVLDEALPWLEAGSDRPFFAWIHLYDPHTPYEPPAPFDSRYPDRPYLGEIAYVDSQVGRLLEALDKAGLGERTVIVLAGDHGESLGEHGEGTHGFFVYEEAIHVPLIVSTPYARLRGVSSDRLVGLSDIMPTVLEMTGLPIPPEVQGTSLVPLFFRPGRDLPGTGRAYAETYYPRLHYGWSDLKSYQDGRFKLILAPSIELYDLEKDPEEAVNLAGSSAGALAAIRDAALPFIEEAGRGALSVDIGRLDEETRQSLAALGYVGSFAGSVLQEGRPLANPRDKIGIFNELSKARESGMAGDAAQAVKAVEAIVAVDPDITDAWFTLGNLHFRMGAFEKAIESFRMALALKPEDSFTVINIANSYQRLGRPEEAERFVLDYLGRGNEDSQLFFLLGGLKFGQGDYDDAARYLTKCLEINPDSASAHSTLAAIGIQRGDLEAAGTHLDKAAALNPKLLNLSYNRAQWLEKRGDAAGAEAAYLRELEYSPRNFRASFNLARLYRSQGREEDERRMLEKTRESNPDFPLTYFYLARILLNRGVDFTAAVALVKRGQELKPEPAEAPLGFFLLADLYGRLGDAAKAESFARRGQEEARKAPRRE